MHSQRLLLSALAVSLLFVTCKKEDDESGGPGPTPSAVTNPLRSYLAQNLADATQTFTVNAVTGGSIQGARGSHVQFVPGAFVTESGAPVTGAVQVKMVEVLTMADMVLMNKQTVGWQGGERRLLKSGGEIKIEAIQGGSEVFIVPNGAVVNIPGGTSADPLMNVFYGTEDSDGDVVWNLSTDTITIQDTAVWDTTNGNWFSYTFAADSLNWINCDYFPPVPYATLQSEAPDGYDHTNTLVWVVFPDQNSVTGTWYNGSLFTTYGVPIGYSAIVVGLHEDADGNYFSSFTNIIVASGITVPITFSPTTLAQFQADVNGL